MMIWDIHRDLVGMKSVALPTANDIVETIF